MAKLPQRLAGVLLLAATVLFYDAASVSALHRLLVPLTMVLAAWLLVQNVTAVFLGATLLAAIHSELGAGDWISARAYPLLAGLGAIVLGFIALQRFRRRIETTREARWRRRQR